MNNRAFLESAIDNIHKEMESYRRYQQWLQDEAEGLHKRKLPDV